MNEIEHIFPHFEEEIRKRLQEEGIFKQVEAGERILRPGSYIPGIPMVLKGRLKVLREGEEKEMLLYHIQPGETCIMSFAGCLNQQTSEVGAIADIDTELVIIPNAQLRPWMKQYPSLNQFLLDLYQKRYLDLLDTLDQVVFFRLDERLYHYLKQQAQNRNTPTLSLTHQQIAQDLGSSREVISRLLKKLEAGKKIRLSHREIELLNEG